MDKILKSTLIKQGRSNPMTCSLERKIKLSKQGSQKEILHLEIKIDPDQISYKVGDAIGIFPKNSPQLVNAVLENQGFTGKEMVTLGDLAPMSLESALCQKLDLHKISKSLIPQLLEATHYNTEKLTLQKYLGDKEFFKGQCLDVLDVFEAVPNTKLDVRTLVNCLAKLTPRLYSISSSPMVNNRSVHITVAAVYTTYRERQRAGICSNYICHILRPGDNVECYIQESKHFSLPEEKGVPIIMVGPGTGVAPFRAFLQERLACNDPGKTWLFFGDRQKKYDFLYEEEFEKLLKKGLLTKLSLAFSRDQDFKIYVQDKMNEQKKELWRWLEEGAYFYVCGDAKYMAKDVEKSLLKIVEDERRYSKEEALNYLTKLKKEKRYQKDVY